MGEIMIARLTLAAISVAAFCGAASAATVYDTTSAVGSNSDHSLWIKGGLGQGIGSDFDFDPAGRLVLNDDGTGSLTGTVVSQNDATSGFEVNYKFDSTFIQPPSFKSQNGSAENATTIFRDLEEGMLEGFGKLAGLVLSISRMPADGKYAAQIGEDANNKNDNLGMAVWFTINVEQASCVICHSNKIKNLDGQQGDINVDLAPVPVPASLPLLIGGLAGLGLMRRRARA